MLFPLGEVVGHDVVLQAGLDGPVAVDAVWWFMRDVVAVVIAIRLSQQFRKFLIGSFNKFLRQLGMMLFQPRKKLFISGFFVKAFQICCHSLIMQIT